MKKHVKAFSLAEVLIALGIIALMASLIFPVMQGNRERAAYNVSVTNLKEVAKAMEKHYLEKGQYPVFANWNELAASDSPLLEYVNEVPKTDEWGRPFSIVESTDAGYIFEGLSAKGRLKEEYPDYTFETNVRYKQKGKDE
jgi:type II secretory pathway pseudopilin PulG